jgi:hypothetical protein
MPILAARTGETDGSKRAFRYVFFELNFHDPNVQAARYESAKKGPATLAGLRVVDLKNLTTGIRQLSHYLGNLRRHLQEIEWLNEMASWSKLLLSCKRQ